MLKEREVRVVLQKYQGKKKGREGEEKKEDGLVRS